MSYYLIDIDTKLDFNKIIIGDIININENLQKIYIYYLDEIPKEIIVKIPPLRLMYNYKNLKYNQIKLPIYPNWNRTKKFIKFIKKIEKFIKLNINYSDYNFINSIDKNENISSIKLNIPPNLKICSTNNTSSNDILLGDLKINGEIECIINISYIWLKNKSYGLSLSCYQLKYTPRVDDIDIDFFDKPLKKIVQVDTVKKCNINNKPSMIISSFMLNEAINKLNKIK